MVANSTVAVAVAVAERRALCLILYAFCFTLSTDARFCATRVIEVREEEGEDLAGAEGDQSAELDFASFAKLMTCKAVSEFRTPEEELRGAFAALDENSDGVITREEPPRT